MRKCLALVLLVTFSWIGGLGQDARAGVTIDVVFRDGTGSALTIMEGDAGPGCSFGGYSDRSVSTGRCMDVILTSTYEMISLSTSVGYDSDNGLAVGSLYQWKGAIVAWTTGGRPGPMLTHCAALVAPTDTGSSIESFGCNLDPPNNPPVVVAGTYRIGTIIWDTSGTTPGAETVAPFFGTGEGVGAIINGEVHLAIWPEIVLSGAVLTIIPEPGTVSLLGLGVVGLTLAARRRLN